MRILSNRNLTNWPSNHLIWEWEDSLAEGLGCDIVTANKLITTLSSGKIQRVLPFTVKWGQPNGSLFMFEGGINLNYLRRYNDKHVVPCIVDFFLNDSQLASFEKQFCRNPRVLISSREVYEHLKEVNVDLNLDYCPLSLPDKYRITGKEYFDKKYDCVLFGRQNRVLTGFMDRYACSHPDFIYVKEGGKKFHYYTSKGKYVGFFGSRKDYFELMKKSRVLLYSTPGIDGGEVRTNGYNQVTPKFLEGLACGCHVIARWKDNADTDWYDLSKFSKNVDDYKMFEEAMDKARSEATDMKQIAAYLENHYTSSIIPIIEDAMSGVLE